MINQRGYFCETDGSSNQLTSSRKPCSGVHHGHVVWCLKNKWHHLPSIFITNNRSVVSSSPVLYSVPASIPLPNDGPWHKSPSPMDMKKGVTCQNSSVPTNPKGTTERKPLVASWSQAGPHKFLGSFKYIWFSICCHSPIPPFPEWKFHSVLFRTRLLPVSSTVSCDTHLC